MTWKEVSRCHHDLLSRMNKTGFPRYGGVRVFQEGDVNQRPHAHWVCTPKLPFARLQRIAREVGFGIVDIHPQPATPFLSFYLSRYLKRGSLPGVRRWATFGEFVGVKTREIEIHGSIVDAWRADFKAAKERGFDGRQAFVDAMVRSQLRKFGIGQDFAKRYVKSSDHILNLAKAKLFPKNVVTTTWADDSWQRGEDPKIGA